MRLISRRGAVEGGARASWTRIGRCVGVRGSILVQVLVMAALMLILATAVIKMAMHRVTLSAKTIQAATAGRRADVVVQAVYAAWSMNAHQTAQGMCTDFRWQNGVNEVCCTNSTCGGAAVNDCNCTCTVRHQWVVNGTPLTVADTATAGLVGGFCKVTANIPYGTP